MTSDFHAHLERSRARLLHAIGAPADLTFVRTPGNIGDLLIHAGTRQLLANVPHREVELAELKHCEGDTVLISGGGAWCGPFHSLPGHVPVAEQRFRRVIVLPSSFDTAIPRVREVLGQTRATVFAREEVSYGMIRDLCAADLAHDCAFFFDFEPYRQAGQGVLTAFRTDQESAFASVPRGNNDVSATCHDLEDWLHTIARHELVRTDRAHVTIAAALLGKRVEYLASSYHKVPAIIDYGLRGLPVTRLPDNWLESFETDEAQITDAEHLRRLAAAVMDRIPEGASFLLVDNDLAGPFPHAARTRLPFLEHDGVYWGAPGDDAHAIAELERMRAAGAGFMVFAWLAFWWLDHYAGVHQHLRTHFRCLEDTDSVKIFDLRTGADSPLHD